jgi:hypothetical protein
VKSLHSDTGFNVKCTSCAEFKSRYACVGTSVLSEDQQETYLMKSKILNSKDEKRYVCKTCQKSILFGKLPKQSERDKSQFTDFPTFFKNKLKRVTNYLSVMSKRKLDVNNEMHVDEALKLNKLESHILKLVIPFIRVAHCPRGIYFKVKGGLILISADIKSSLTKILPQPQSLIPVCLKRKLEYTGNYIEEIIDKDKVKTYFNFFKTYNPLFKEIILEEGLIEKYESDCLSKTAVFNDDEKETEEESEQESEQESSDDIDFQQTTYEHNNHKESNESTRFYRDQSSVFCDKYEVDGKVTTVANKLANIIVNYEQTLKSNDIEDKTFNFDIEDELYREESDMEEESSFLNDLETESVLYKDQSGNFQNLCDEFISEPIIEKPIPVSELNQSRGNLFSPAADQSKNLNNILS